MNYLLDVQHLDKTLGTFHLHDISFHLEPGYITGLIGQNGCGKTSLVKTILNLYQKDAGNILINGHSMETEEIAAKDRIGVVLDQCLFDEDTKVETNARCFGSLYSRYDHRLFLEFCRRFDVDPKKKVKKLSKGQKTRFQLAFAFSHDANVFLMDEPSAGLDPLFRKELLGYMQEIVEDGTRSILFSTHITEDHDANVFLMDEPSAGLDPLFRKELLGYMQEIVEDGTRSILFSTHITEDLDQIGDYILLMDHGHLVLDLTREELADRYLLLHGTREELKKLDSKIIICNQFGQYRNSTLIDSVKADSHTYGTDRYLLLHGTREELKKLDSKIIICNQFGQYRNSTLIDSVKADSHTYGSLTVTRPSLEDLMCCFHEGGVIQ